jgi:hypothetical protein
VLLGILPAACTPQKESTLTYPAAVVAAHYEQQYRTALWYVYTKGLDSKVFKKYVYANGQYSTVFRQKAQVDSIQALQRQLLGLERHLKQIDKRGGSVRFTFDSDFKTPAQRAFMYKLCGYSCGYNPRNSLSPVAAVWVNEHDGLIDSVLDYNNIIRTAGLPSSLPTKRAMPWNQDQPCKAAFLQQNQAWLNTDLRQLCQAKHLLVR